VAGRFGRIAVLLAVVAVRSGLAAIGQRHSATIAGRNGRDLARATPESVAVSSVRLRRLDAGMQRFVDEVRLAGVTTPLARRGKTINFNAFSKRDIRTNHLQGDALKTMRPGTGWGLGFRVVVDAAAAGEPTNDGTFDWFGIGGTWFWIDPAADVVSVGMTRHRGRTNDEIRGLSRILYIRRCSTEIQLATNVTPCRGRQVQLQGTVPISGGCPPPTGVAWGLHGPACGRRRSSPRFRDRCRY
jgi:CubicO group peptidase (beta-lactamase class C family)